MKWRRTGSSITVSGAFTQKTAGGIVFIFKKDPRTVWQKIKDWYAVQLKNETRPVYIDPTRGNWKL